MANPKARPAREAPKGGSESEDKPDKKHLVQQGGKYNIVLHRDSDNGRQNARALLKATALYDDEAQIKKGVEIQRSVKKAKGAARTALIAEKVPKYKLEYVNKDQGGAKNFTLGGRPYGNESHHILVCELFYDEYGWTEEHLEIVRQTLYNINNPHNIIYLPLSDAAAKVHDLPNHKKGHYDYSNKVLDSHVKTIFNQVDQAKDEAESKGKCEPQTLKDIYDLLIAVEDEYWTYLIKRGAKAMA